MEQRKRIGAAGWVWLFLSICTGIASADYTPGNHIDETIFYGGSTRYYDVHVPASYTGATPVPSRSPTGIWSACGLRATCGSATRTCRYQVP